MRSYLTHTKHVMANPLYQGVLNKAVPLSVSMPFILPVRSPSLLHISELPCAIDKKKRNSMKSVQHDNLRAAVRAMISAAGSGGDEPELVADNLVYANLTGHDSHGVGMLPTYLGCVLTGELKSNQHASVISEDGAIVVIDGNAGYGQVIGGEAMDIGIDRARKHGVCVLAIRSSFHLCRIGAWGERCAASGMVSMHHVNMHGHYPLVAPFRGSDARTSTNPYCCTLPATDNIPPVVVDFATSVIAMGKVRVANNKGETLPDGILFNGAREATNDPEAMFVEPRGAIRPMGEHKGYCMNLVNELLAGAFTGSKTCRTETDHENHTILNNMLSIIIDPQRLAGENGWQGEYDEAIAQSRASPPEHPGQPVLIPGEPERQMMAQRKRDGVPIDDETWQQLLNAADSVGLASTEFARLAGQTL